MKDIAEVKDSTEDFRSFTRINGQARRPPEHHQAVGHQHRADRRRRPPEVARINQGSTGIKLSVLNDSSVFIERAIHSCRSTR